MKIHPLFLKIMAYTVGRSNLLGSTVDEWYASGCPVVEEPTPDFGPEIHTHDAGDCLACARRWHDLDLTKKALAAANARIKELEGKVTESFQHGNPEVAHRGLFQTSCKYCLRAHNAALEEAALIVENLQREKGKLYDFKTATVPEYIAAIRKEKK